MWKKFWRKVHLALCTFPGWHSCTENGFDGVSFHGICKYCGRKCLQDSNGDWFSHED